VPSFDIRSREFRQPFRAERRNQRVLNRVREISDRAWLSFRPPVSREGVPKDIGDRYFLAAICALGRRVIAADHAGESFLCEDSRLIRRKGAMLPEDNPADWKGATVPGPVFDPIADRPVAIQASLESLYVNVADHVARPAGRDQIVDCPLADSGHSDSCRIRARVVTVSSP
jgi:hypothetical protein